MNFSERYGPIRLPETTLDERTTEVQAWVARMRDSGGGPSNGTVRRHIEETWPDMNLEEIAYVFDKAKGLE